MDILGFLLVGGVNFGRNLIGIILRPYETYRRLTERGSLFELPFIGLLLALYFAVASLVKTNAFRPFLLTAIFVKLALAAGAGFILAVTTFWLVGRLLGSQVKLKGLAIGWAYSLVPTLIWFLSTSILYLILPPPRTTSPAGMIFSLVFLVFSCVLFFWKIILGYFTLRFSLRLDLVKILILTIAALPFIGLYSYGMYRLGVFRVPFL